MKTPRDHLLELAEDWQEQARVQYMRARLLLRLHLSRQSDTHSAAISQALAADDSAKARLLYSMATANGEDAARHASYTMSAFADRFGHRHLFCDDYGTADECVVNVDGVWRSRREVQRS